MLLHLQDILRNVDKFYDREAYHQVIPLAMESCDLARLRLGNRPMLPVLSFYEHFLKGLPREQASREAQLEMKANIHTACTGVTSCVKTRQACSRLAQPQ